MTQEVQPLAWQKRTNLEEHQQFFSKINEIIGNLAPTVDEAEAAIAQATQAVTAANAAVATANAASANADAAAQQAQTAAGTVAGYDDRMTAAESKNTQQDAAITALQTADGQNVKLSGNQTIIGIKTVPTEATGTHSQQIANSDKIGAELDNYAPMVRTTGNYTIYGEMTINRMICGNLIPNKKQTAPYGYGTNGENWHKTYTGKLAPYSRGGTLIVYDVNNGNFGVFVILGYSGLIRADRVIGDFPLERIKVCKGTTESDTDFAIYFNASSQGNRLWVYIDSDFSSLNANTPYPSTSIFTPLVPTIPENDPSTTGVWTTVVTGVE